MSPSAPSIPAKALLALIQVYKWTLSPFIGRDCRYLPTCSSYAADAVRAHGAWAGSWMAFARLCRCHPLGGRGYDPAPDVTNGKWWAPWTYGDWRGGYRAPPESAPEHDHGHDHAKPEIS
jgi:putative membrane protein insertion efficiency factor